MNIKWPEEFVNKLWHTHIMEYYTSIINKFIL